MAPPAPAFLRALVRLDPRPVRKLAEAADVNPSNLIKYAEEQPGGFIGGKRLAKLADVLRLDNWAFDSRVRAFFVTGELASLREALGALRTRHILVPVRTPEQARWNLEKAHAGSRYAIYGVHYRICISRSFVPQEGIAFPPIEPSLAPDNLEWCEQGRFALLDEALITRWDEGELTKREFDSVVCQAQEITTHDIEELAGSNNISRQDLWQMLQARIAEKARDKVFEHAPSRRSAPGADGVKGT